MSFTKIASTYPIWLPPLPKKRIAGEWVNLANVESLIFEPKDEKYIIRFSSGASRLLDKSHAVLISDEFREMVTERRSPPTKPQPKQPA